MNINEIKSELGEGLYWSAQQGILYWLDINNSMLFSFKEEICSLRARFKKCKQKYEKYIKI